MPRSPPPRSRYHSSPPLTPYQYKITTTAGHNNTRTTKRGELRLASTRLDRWEEKRTTRTRTHLGTRRKHTNTNTTTQQRQQQQQKTTIMPKLIANQRGIIWALPPSCSRSSYTPGRTTSGCVHLLVHSVLMYCCNTV